MGNMKHRRGIDSLLALAHVGLCAVLIIAACGQLRSVDAFNVNIVSFIRNGVTTTTKIAPNDRTKVFIGGHVAASSGGYDKPAGRDPHPPGVNRHGAHHDRLVLPTSSRGFIVASRLFSSTDASLSDGDGLADEDDGNDERNADKFDFEQLNTSTDERVQKFKEAVLGNIQGGEKFRNLNALRSVIQYLKLYDALTGLNQFETDDEFAVRVIATCINDNLFNQLVGNDNVPGISIAERKLELVRRIYEVEEPGLDMEKLVIDVAFWNYMNNYKSKLAEGTFNLLEEINNNILNQNWNLTEVQEKCRDHRKLKFLSGKKSTETLMQVLKCILHASDMNAKARIECRLAAQNGFTENLKSFEVANKKDAISKSYFIGDGCFRHEGKLNGKDPPRVVLSKKDENEDDNKLPFVFYSASGTGKSVEIAGSGYTRSAVLAIVHDGSESYDVGEIEKEKLKDEILAKHLQSIANEYINDNIYSKILQPIISDVFERDVQMQNDQTLGKPPVAPTWNGYGNGNAFNNNTISIVLAIDEASVCPVFVKTIISKYKEAGKEVAKVFCARQIEASQTLRHHKIEVLFSFAGTGASNSAVGSKPENFVHHEPSAKVDAAEVYEVLRTSFENHDETLPTYLDLTDKYPVLGCLVSHNARMISIFLKTLSTHPEKIKYPGTQNEIICDVFETFMKCNGLKSLNTAADKIMVAAQALAVHLFQSMYYTGEKPDKIILQEFEYGISFDPNLPLKSMKELVTNYGIITPNELLKKPSANCCDDKRPFEVDETMQLLCLWMLMQGKKQGYSDGLVQTSSFGFEVLATEIVGAVVTSSTTLRLDKRPTLAELMKDYLKFSMVNSKKNLQRVANEKMVKLRKDKDYKPAEAEEGEESEMVKKIRQNDGFESVLKYYKDHENSLQAAQNKYMQNITRALDDYIMSEQVTLTEEAVLAKLQGVKAVPVHYTGGTAFYGTYFQNSKMEVKKLKYGDIEKCKSWSSKHRGKVQVVDSTHTKQDTVPVDDFEDKTVLCMDTQLGDMLLGMRAAPSAEEKGKPRPFFAPITSLAWGTSPLADGYLVFYAQRVVNGVLDEEPFRCCIAIQAKDYLGKTSLPFDGSIANNQGRMEHPILDNFLGKCRIYCVASYDEKLKRGSNNPGTHVIGYPVDDSPPILKEMLGNLSGRRGDENAANRFQSIYVNDESEQQEDEHNGHDALEATNEGD